MIVRHLREEREYVIEWQGWIRSFTMWIVDRWGFERGLTVEFVEPEHRGRDSLEWYDEWVRNEALAQMIVFVEREQKEGKV
jgi:hypothetical protein